MSDDYQRQQMERDNRRKQRQKSAQRHKAVGAALIVLALAISIAVPILQYLFIQVPADVAYGNAFGGDVIIAYDQADFGGIQQQVNVIWTNMNNTWPPGGPTAPNHRLIYNSWWPWDKTKDNTLYGEDLYFNKLLERIAQYQVQWQTIQQGKVIVQGDWYNNAMQSLRSEMNSSGGLDWAIKGAYYLDFYPAAYWAPIYNIAAWAVAAVIGVSGAVFIMTAPNPYDDS